MTNATTETDKAGLGDLAEIFYAPSAVFARRMDGKFGVPYLALIVLGTIIYLATKGLIQPVIDAEISRAMAAAAAKNPQMTADRVASMTSIARAIGSFGAIGLYLIGPFLVALLAWIAGKFFAKVEVIGTVALMIATFSFYPRLIGNVVAAIFAAMLPEGGTLTAASISLSPARFVDVVAHPSLGQLLARFDLFVLWGVALIAIGVRVAGKATAKQGWTTAIVVWLVPTLLAIWGVIKNG